ncbi:ATP-binding protein [Streptomyces sp. NPDC058953]|uniref:ATP-binding protein n=1 Tax=unclassified Streptomyces TaxID=2593676 RepID=UPI0036BE0DAA
MSLPLTRRIARAALLIAAGAAPVVGAAGSASAVDLGQAAPVAGLTALDADGVSTTVDGAARQTTELAGGAGGDAVRQTVPAAGKALGGASRAAAPAAEETAGEAAGNAGGLLGKTADGAAKSLGDSGLTAGSLEGGLPTEALPMEGLTSGGLPVETLPTGGVPLMG